MLTPIVTKTIGDQIQETTTGNKVQYASNQVKNKNEGNDETE